MIAAMIAAAVGVTLTVAPLAWALGHKAGRRVSGDQWQCLREIALESQKRGEMAAGFYPRKET
jgi:hypothetical protein